MSPEFNREQYLATVKKNVSEQMQSHIQLGPNNKIHIEFGVSSSKEIRAILEEYVDGEATTQMGDTVFEFPSKIDSPRGKLFIQYSRTVGVIIDENPIHKNPDVKTIPLSAFLD